MGARLSRVDLHVHTTASDGTLTPTQTVAEATRLGVTILAITDHDITDGVPEGQAAAREAGIVLVPGVELSAELEGREVHLLGYFVDVGNARLQHLLSDLRRRRDQRNREILARLRSLGAPVAAERVRAIGGEGSVGRPHIAVALVEAGHASSLQEAFRRYLAAGRPAYVPGVLLGIEEACAAIKQAGGICVVAHAAKLGSLDAVQRVIAVGAEGVEAFHCDHSEAEAQSLVAFARERSLVVTGGSDSHGPHPDRPVPIGSVAVPDWVGEELLARAPSWWRQPEPSP
jgi:predicted metal-dependent phosphoesterase TrpH